MRLGRIERAKLDMVKVIRTKVRLKHAILADNELRDLLPVALAEFDQKVQQGRLKGPEKFDVQKTLTEVAESLDKRLNGEQ